MDFFSKGYQIHTADLVTFTEEILSEKLHFLCSCLKNNWVTQRIFLYADIKWRKVKGDLEIFSHELIYFLFAWIFVIDK